jgi:hypothetical protein
MERTPVTSLDTRFSDPSATATPWAAAEAALAAAQLSWISTTRADGRPHVTPLVAVWLDGALHVSTGAGEQKALNLAANPHVAVTTGCDRWDGGLDVVVEGVAERVTDRDRLSRLADAWATKWDGQWQYTVGDGVFVHDVGEALVYGIEPTKVLAFGKSPFSATSHRF